MMVPDVLVGLPHLLGNFFEGMSFEEMQSEGIPLVFSERLQDLPPAISPEQTFDGLAVVCALVAVMVTFNWFVSNSRQIKSLGLQSPSS